MIVLERILCLRYFDTGNTPSAQKNRRCMGLFFKNEFGARTQKSPVLQAWPDPGGLLDAGEPEDGSEQAVRGLLLQSNFPYMDAIWP